MFKVKAVIPALLLSAAMLAPAGALPGKLVEAAQVAPMQMNVADRDSRAGDRDGRYRDRDFRHRGDRYYGRGYARRGPPPGWRRYGSRPRDWRTRGCLEIGPAWFCP